MTEQDILSLIKEDSLMMGVLERAESLNLPNWLIGSGFVRNKVWNHFSGRKTEGIDATDIDLVYLDPTSNDQTRDELLMQTLHEETGLDWELRNNAYNYKSDTRSEYPSEEDVIAHWPETVTAIGVRIENGDFKLIAPYGIEDIVNFVVRPSPKYIDGVERNEKGLLKRSGSKNGQM